MKRFYSPEKIDKFLGLNVRERPDGKSWEKIVGLDVARAHQEIRTTLSQILQTPELSPEMVEKIKTERIFPELKVFEKNGEGEISSGIKAAISENKIKVALEIVDGMRKG